MSLRSFTVFKDVPDVEPRRPPPSRRSERISSLSKPVTSTTSLSKLSSVGEKENVHPITGELSTQSKKRKTSGLGTKSATPLAAKLAESLDSNPEAKRRKSSTTSSKKVKTGAKKDRKPLGASKKTGQQSRRPSPLPPVDEVGESEREGERITLADIDSRCYELTVKPLADVSQAYDDCADQSSALNEGISSDKKVIHVVKEPSAEPVIRDYFSPSLSSSALPSTTPITTVFQDVKDFSTPERREIYAAFIFASPPKWPSGNIRSKSTPPTTAVRSTRMNELPW